MNLHHLSQNANRIGGFFEATPDRAEAMAGIADHIKKFWEPRMRSQLLAAIDAGTLPELSPLVLEAIAAYRAKLQPLPAHS